MAVPHKPTTREENREAVRERLLDAALVLFNQKGYGATSVREIVEAAGVTKPVLYYYFKSKEGVFQAIMERALVVYSAGLEEARAFRGTFRERVIHLCLAIYDLYSAHIEIPQLLFSVFYGPSREAPDFDFDAFPRKFEEAFMPLMHEGIASGELRDAPPNHLLIAVAGTIHLAMEEKLNARCKPPRVGREDIAPILDLIFTGTAGTPGKKEKR